MNLVPYPKAVPAGLTIIDDRQGTGVARHWYSAANWVFFVFVLVWDSFAVAIWAVIILLVFPDHFSILLSILPLLFMSTVLLISCLCITYSSIASFFNKTRIYVHADRVDILIGPLPWAGSRSFPRTDLNEFTVSAAARRDRGVAVYQIIAVDRSNRDQSLVGGFTSREQAEYVRGFLKHIYSRESPRTQALV